MAGLASVLMFTMTELSHACGHAFNLVLSLQSSWKECSYILNVPFSSHSRPIIHGPIILVGPNPVLSSSSWPAFNHLVPPA